MKSCAVVPEASLGFRIGFDQSRYRMFEGTALRDPAAFTVVHTVEIDGMLWETSRKKLIDLRKKRNTESVRC